MALTQVPLGMMTSDAQYTGFKNRIINGGMTIDQRNAGASVTPTNGSYTLDRWLIIAYQASKFTVQQNAGSVTLPTGYANYLGVTSSSAYTVGSAEYFSVKQRIEGNNLADLAWGTASASSVTLSFWVRSSLTGTFGGSLTNGSANRSYPFSYTVSSANTWEQKTITVAGDTTGTWAATTGTGLSVNFSLGAGSTFSSSAGSWQAGQYESATGATSVVGTSGATFYITGVQLEKGGAATAFDYRPYGTELALCQRYYRQSSLDTYGEGTIYGYNNVSGSIGQAIAYPVAMRAAPTMSYAGTWVRTNCSGNLAAGTSGYFAYISITSLGAGNQYSNGTGYLTFNAEL